MENKYYTPDIEEFHVEFEFEFQGLDCNWSLTGWDKVKLNTDDNKNFGLYTLKHIESVLNDTITKIENHIRVKYLDKEDIESLEFIYDGQYCEGFQFYRPINIEDSFTRFIVLDLFDDKITITKLMDYSKTSRINGIKLFEGKIKNKSELVKLLKQLGI